MKSSTVTRATFSSWIKSKNVRQILRYEQFKNCFRELDVSYITGETGAGKDTFRHGRSTAQNKNVTDYDHPFDSYKGQDVIVFEEFRSSFGKFRIC